MPGMQSISFKLTSAVVSVQFQLLLLEWGYTSDWFDSGTQSLTLLYSWFLHVCLLKKENNKNINRTDISLSNWSRHESDFEVCDGGPFFQLEKCTGSITDAQNFRGMLQDHQRSYLYDVGFKNIFHVSWSLPFAITIEILARKCIIVLTLKDVALKEQKSDMFQTIS